ncbi:uncharacterized protein [Dermacentor andersoni]|uniref:uncharacterized protein n=1 Tax=Dermacentor andersoni TaxID=34620 RepID=UPI003B3B7096
MESYSALEAARAVTNGLTNGVANEDGPLVNGAAAPARKPKGVATAGDALLQDSFYPLQKGPYISPNYRLSAESKRLVRQAQEPVLASSPATVHLIYEVGLETSHSF